MKLGCCVGYRGYSLAKRRMAVAILFFKKRNMIDSAMRALNLNETVTCVPGISCRRHHHRLSSSTSSSSSSMMLLFPSARSLPSNQFHAPRTTGCRRTRANIMEINVGLRESILGAEEQSSVNICSPWRGSSPPNDLILRSGRALISAQSVAAKESQRQDGHPN